MSTRHHQQLLVPSVAVLKSLWHRLPASKPPLTLPRTLLQPRNLVPPSPSRTSTQRLHPRSVAVPRRSSRRSLWTWMKSLSLSQSQSRSRLPVAASPASHRSRKRFRSLRPTPLPVHASPALRSRRLSSPRSLRPSQHRLVNPACLRRMRTRGRPSQTLTHSKVGVRRLLSASAAGARWARVSLSLTVVVSRLCRRQASQATTKRVDCHLCAVCKHPATCRAQL